MKTNDSSRRVASKRLVLATETVKSLGVRTGVQTGLAIGVGSGGGSRTLSCAVACGSIGLCQTV
jgi:hypothetical protein